MAGERIERNLMAAEAIVTLLGMAVKHAPQLDPDQGGECEVSCLTSQLPILHENAKKHLSMTIELMGGDVQVPLKLLLRLREFVVNSGCGVNFTMPRLVEESGELAVLIDYFTRDRSEDSDEDEDDAVY